MLPQDDQPVPPPEATEPPAARPPLWGPGASLGLALVVVAVWLAVQAVALVALGAVTMLAAPARPPDVAGGLPEMGLALSLTTLAAAPAGVALTLLVARLRRGAGVREYFGWRRPTLRQALVWTLALAAFLAAYDLLARALGRPPSPPVMVDAYRTAVVPALFWLAVVVAAPLFEETLFRGFLLPGLARARWLGTTGAVLVSSAFFAALHVQYDLFDLTAVFALGALFAAVRLASGSLQLAVGLHGLTNLLAMVQIATLVEPL
jgi:membrane protease YdiL (CAAX protease family)